MGIPAVCSYGLTEACSQVATEDIAMADGRSCGLPLPGVDIRICNEEAGGGGVGEIEIRGKTILVSEGWYKTGDFGYLDTQGRLVVLSRRADLIISGGENIYPAEIERVLMEHPGVCDAAVGACPSEHWGQVPIALVVFKGSLVEEALLRHCRQHLAGYKIPKAVFAVDELPRNAAGKTDRQKLKELIRQRFASSSF
jgi:O-succinylbenzoic acid--CoA ligase